MKEYKDLGAIFLMDLVTFLDTTQNAMRTVKKEDYCVPDTVLCGLWEDLKSTMNIAELCNPYVAKLIGRCPGMFTKVVSKHKKHDKLCSKRKLLFLGKKRGEPNTGKSAIPKRAMEKCVHWRKNQIWQTNSRRAKKN
ncbi:hypothetical protein PR048_011546 [Dryococelus australis]|uniref:Uncharacterized protein n=1 Tax=Dryococelus australis TaxID=614101 RepID=A0ABQ9HLV8_9NEOP|nr:hypothetical protein PR048_011546 [Dryococelus australis]